MLFEKEFDLNKPFINKNINFNNIDQNNFDNNFIYDEWKCKGNDNSIFGQNSTVKYIKAYITIFAAIFTIGGVLLSPFIFILTCCCVSYCYCGRENKTKKD